jgi:hypothetical protein
MIISNKTLTIYYKNIRIKIVIFPGGEGDRWKNRKPIRKVGVVQCVEIN